MQVALKSFETIFPEFPSDFDAGPIMIRREIALRNSSEAATRALDKAMGRDVSDTLAKSDFDLGSPDDPMLRFLSKIDRTSGRTTRTLAKRSSGDDGLWKSCGSYSWRFANDENGEYITAKLNRPDLQWNVEQLQ